MEKITDVKILKETFPKFELIKSIELRENEKGQKYYSINYELDNETFAVIVITLERKKPLLINGLLQKLIIKSLKKA